MSESDVAVSTTDSGLACLSILFRFFGLPLDPAQVKHQFSPNGDPLDANTVILAARGAGLKARRLSATWDHLKRMRVPVIAIHRDGRFFVIAKASDDHALVHDPIKQTPETVHRAEVESIWGGEFIVVTRRSFWSEEDHKFDMTWFIPAVVKYRKMFAEVILASLLIQFFSLITPLFFLVVIDKVLVHNGLSTLDVLVIALLMVTVFDFLLNVLRTYVFTHTTNRIDVELGAKLFSHLVALPMSFYQSRRAGHIISRVRELDTVRNFLTGPPLTVAIDLLFTVVFLGLMYYYSPLLTLVVIGAFPFYFLISFLITPTLRARLQEKFGRGAENQAFLVEAVNGIETAKSMAIEPQLRDRWDRQLAGYISASFKVAKLSIFTNQGTALINKITVALTLWLGAKAVLSGDMTVGQLVAFNMLANRVHTPVLRMAQLWQEFQQVRVSLQRLGDIFDTTPEPSFNPNRTALPSLEGRITFDHVTFRYNSESPEILKDISLTIEPDQVVGVIGPSGSGKSTLTKLIQRMYVPERGRVLLDGVDLAIVDTAWLRRQIGVVLQENFLFNASVRENIAIASPGMPMEEIVEVARTAGAHDFIMELPLGYDTLAGERGSNLSGGQRQRIAIARALATNPRILILDEATSALDHEAERHLIDNLPEIAKGRTVIAITHRIAVLRHAGRVLCLRGGKIVEDGAPDELLKADGPYADFYKHQVG